MVTKGTVVKVVRGVKVPRGTTGVVFWVGDTKYGARVGFKDDAGEVHWTAAGNVEPLAAVPVVAPAKVATLVEMAGALDAGARMAALEARVAALEAALAAKPAAPKPPMPLGDYGNAMEYRMVLDEMAAGGDAAALAELTALDAALDAAERRAA